MKSRITDAAENYKQSKREQQHIMLDDIRIAFLKGAEYSNGIVDEFLRLHPEYRCLDVIGKFNDFLHSKTSQSSSPVPVDVREVASKELHEENIGIKIQNNDPKENPITYEINCLQDIADCITNENVHGFLIDFEGCLLSYLLARGITNDMISKGEVPADTKIAFPSMKWIDDWKPLAEGGKKED